MMRARIRAVGAAVFVAAASWSLPAAAQGAAEAQLRQVVSEIEAFIAAQSAGQASLRTSRPIETRMEGGAAVATLADLALAGRNGNAVELGTVTVTQREIAPGRLRYELALPRRIRAVDRSGNAMVAITAGEGSLAVVRDVASGLVREVDFRTADLDAPPPTPTGVATFIGGLELGWTINDRADGASDAAARVSVRDLRARRARGGEAARLGELSIALGVQGVRIEQLERVRSAFVSGPAGDQRLARAAEALVAIAAAGGLASLTTEIAVANGVYEDGGATPLVAIERASLGHALSGVNQPAAEYQIRYTQQGLALRPGSLPAPQYMPYIPLRANVALALQQIPTQLLLGQLLARGSAPLAAAVATAINGMTVRFAPIELDAAAVGATLNGSLTGDSNAPLQATGDGELVVRGLDTVLRELNAQPQSGRGGQSPAAVLAILAALGQQGTGADGQPTRSYRIEVTQAGQLMLNGTDMTPLLGAARGGGRPARPPTTPPPAPAQPPPSK